MADVINCPLCPFSYEVRPLDPRVLDPMALAGVFGPGIMTQTALNQRAQDTERALREHFETHATAEWLAEVTRLGAEVARLRAAYEDRAPTPEAYDAACAALHRHRGEEERLRAREAELLAQVAQLTRDLESGSMAGAYARLKELQGAERERDELRAWAESVRAGFEGALDKVRRRL